MANTVLESATVNNDVAAVMYNVTCSTAAATAAKTAIASAKFALFSGVRVRATFTNGNTAENPTLSINSSVAVPLKADGGNAVATMSAGAVVDLIYDGTSYVVSGVGMLPPSVKTWAEDTFVQKAGALTGVTATSPLSASTSSGIANVSHNDSGVTAGSKGDTTNQTPAFGGTFKALSGTVDAKGHITAFDEHTVTMPSSEATQSASGLMSATDKTKLDGIAAGADNVSFSQTQTSGSEIGTLTINSTDTKLYAPIQTDISGNAGTATALQTARLIDGISFDGTSNITHYGYCTSNALNMTVDIAGFTSASLVDGARIVVRFQYSTPASGPTLNVSSTGAKNIVLKAPGGTLYSPGNKYWDAGSVIEMVYASGFWVIVNGEIASTSHYGVTLLSNDYTSTNQGMAATPYAVKQVYNLANGKPSLTSTVTPIVDGTAAIGDSTEAARANHVHPTDTSRVPVVGKGENLLKNWCFVGGGTPNNLPVNSYNKYDYPSTSTEAIDGWVNATNCHVVLNANYLTITEDIVYQPFQFAVFRQYVSGRVSSGASVTISLLTTDSLYTASGTLSTSELFAALDSNGSRVGVYWDAATSVVVFDIDLMSPNNDKTINIIAAKLECGSEQTLARLENGTWVLNDPYPNYQDEVLRCSNGFTPVFGKGENLLDNWYFAGGGTSGVCPVNQRGNTGANAYQGSGGTIDRWSSNGGTVGVLSDGITLSGYNSGGQLYQYIENYAAYKGKDLTVSVLGSSSDGNSYYITVYDGINYIAPTVFSVSKGLCSRTFTLSPNATCLHVVIANWVSGATASLEAVKLELGRRQTLAHLENGSWVLNDPPPNYGDELRKCQRYLWIPDSGALCFTRLIDGLYKGVLYFPATMASIPVVTATSSNGTFNYGAWKDAFVFDVGANDGYIYGIKAEVQ